MRCLTEQAVRVEPRRNLIAWRPRNRVGLRTGLQLGWDRSGNCERRRKVATGVVRRRVEVRGDRHLLVDSRRDEPHNHLHLLNLLVVVGAAVVWSGRCVFLLRHVQHSCVRATHCHLKLLPLRPAADRRSLVRKELRHLVAQALGRVCQTCRKRPPCFSTSPVSVPSLPGQNDRF
jgi:hypothetical protein